MKRFIVSVFFIIICFLLQTTVFKGLSFGGIVPNLMIILTASFGFMRGEKTGLIMGFCCGFLIDIFFGSVLGLNAMIYMYIGYANGKFNRIFYPDDIKLPLILILVSDFVYGFSYYVILFLMRRRFNINYYLLHIILPEMVYTIFITLLLYPLILWINKKIEASEKGVSGNLFDEFRENFFNIVTSRVFVLVLIMISICGIMINRIFDLQIVHGEEYLDSFQMKIMKERTINGSRGCIYDRNGNLLAYNELAHSVTIEDVYESGRYKNLNLNTTIYKLINIIERNGDSISSDFKIVLDKNGRYIFTVEGTQLNRFLADVYGHVSIEKLEEKERTATHRM